MDRFSCLHKLADLRGDHLVMTTYIGAVSFEWAAITGEDVSNAHLGQMGDVIGLAVGLALALPHRRVVCIDGDGSVLMELGQLVLLGQEQPPNLTVVVIDNETYESIGWQGTGRMASATAKNADLASIARGCGVDHTYTVRELAEFERVVARELAEPHTSFVVAKVAPSTTSVSPRQVDAREDKYRFVRHIERLEGKRILRLAQQDEQLKIGAD
jgi:thiamine pyrophosphate-dependent acetolactate synthase large subunit-like protein